MYEKHNLLLASGIVSLTAYQNTPAPLGQQNPILPKTEHANLIPAHASSQMLMEARRGGAEGMGSADRLVTCWSPDQQIEALWLPWCVHESAPSHPWSGSHTCNQRQWRPEESSKDCWTVAGNWKINTKPPQTQRLSLMLSAPFHASDSLACPSSS